MNLAPFVLERYFDKHEFSARYVLSSSDCETLPVSELLTMADTQTLELWKTLSLGYTQSAGHPILRREIANLYKTVWPDDVLVLTPEEGIFVAMNTLLNPGDHAIVLAPAYESLYKVAAGIGADVSRWTLATDGIRWNLDLSALDRIVKHSTRLLAVNFPHNPTGFHVDTAAFERIVDFAKHKRLILFSDEMYRYSEYRESARLPGACDVYEQAVTLGGLSKSFGLPGLRIGWLATKDQTLMKRFRGFKDYTTICSSAPSEILAIAALRARDSILDRTKKIVGDNLEIAGAFFARFHRHFEWIRPSAGPVAFPRLKGTDSIERFCEKLLEAKNAMLAPGSLFEFPDNHFRIGLGRRNFPEGLEKMKDFLEEQYS